jgi:hypothetical protein
VPPNGTIAASMISELGSATTARTAVCSGCTVFEISPSAVSTWSAPSRSNSEPTRRPVEPPTSMPSGPPRMPTSRPVRPPAAVPTGSAEPTRSFTAMLPSAARRTTTPSWTPIWSCASSSLSFVRAPYALTSSSNATAITL